MSNSDPSHSDSQTDDQTSEMTDEARAVIGRARRSFGMSLAILMLGFIAIAVALVYRSSQEQTLADRYALESLTVPAGAEIVSVVPADDLLAVTMRLEGETLVHLIAGESGELVREIPVSQGD